MSEFVKIASCFILFLIISGCIGVSEVPHLVSRATFESNEISISDVGKFKVDGVVLVVKPANSVAVGEGQGVIIAFPSKFDPKDYFYSSIYYYYKDFSLTTKDPFILEILISTRSHEISFDPMGIILREKDGKIDHPVSYYSLAPRYSHTFSLRHTTDLCRHPEDQPWQINYSLLPKYENISRNPVLLSKEEFSCYAVKFDVPPIDPRSEFRVEISDFSVDGRKRHIPTILYLPGTYTSKSH